MNTKKQTISVICLVLATSLLCVQTASAGSMNAGDSFDTATQIEPGFYEDELTESEEKYSYIILKPGQELVYKLTADDLAILDTMWSDVFDEDRSQIGELARNGLHKGDTRSFYFSTSSTKDSYKFYIKIRYNTISSKTLLAKYHTSISIENHFDANSETDAGDNFNDALSILPGNYEGYLARENNEYIGSYIESCENAGNDLMDFYKISIQPNDKVTVALTPSQEASLHLSIYNEDRECIKTEESKEAGAIARTQWLADSSQYIYIQVKGVHENSRRYNDAGEYYLDITTQKAPINKKQIPPESDPESESKSESEEQPGFETLIALISLVGVYIGLKKK